VIVAARQEEASWSPALRLLADRGRRTARRVPAVAGALAGRLAGPRTYAIWPSIARPHFAVDVAHPPAAAWLRATFEPDARSVRFADAATWSALRTRGLLYGRPGRTLSDVLAGTGHAVGGIRLALYSPSGGINSKITCFAFACDRPEPDLVIKAMPDRRFMERLRHETEIVEAIRRRLGAAGAAGALPLPPLFAGTVAGEYVVAQPVDPLARATGATGEFDLPFDWLRAFQAGTSPGRTPWSAVDTEAELAAVRDAWQRARPEAAEAVTARACGLLRRLEGLPVDRCAVHGDFWRGNLARRGDRLRVYDWEWARERGTPFFDLWTWELGPLRRRAELGAGDFAPQLADAVTRVAERLRAQDLDPRFAAATLAGSLGELTFRIRRTTGTAGGAEAESARLMDATAAVLASM
jgi:hypothetical protein